MTQETRHIAVIDIGKTNAKLVLIERISGTQVATVSRPNQVLDTAPYPHHDTKSLWHFICDGLKDMHAKHRVDAISITTHGATAVLMAGNELALPILDYEHDGPTTCAKEYRSLRPDFAETLSPPLPNGLNLGAQIYWQQKAFPQEFARTTAILMYPQYWAFRLTGVLVSEVTSLGTHTDLWNPQEKSFSTLVDTAGWRDLFPPISAATSVIGNITPDIAAQTGLDIKTPVACGIHDSNASLLPYLRAVAHPFSVVSSGTWTITMTIGGLTDGLDEARDSLANVDAFGSPVPTARFMGGREFELIMQGKVAEPSEADIASIIEKSIMVLPSFVPGVGPFPNATGRWVGAAENLTRAERTAATSLYMALMTHVCLSMAGTGNSIIVEGPLAKNITYCAALATLAGKPVHASSDATGTSMGAAMLFDDFESATSGVSADTPVQPLSNDGFHAYAQQWLKLVEADQNQSCPI